MGNTFQRCNKNNEGSNSFTFPDFNELEIFTCQICFEPILPYDKKFKNKDICIHPFCKDCIAKYIQIKVEEDKVALVKCPALQCDFNLDPLSCRLILPTKLFEKCCDLLCQNSILGVDSCFCPHRNCSALITNECGGDVKRSVCPNCNRSLCFKCKITWHDDILCKDKREINDQNDLAFWFLERINKWKRCNRCGHCIELLEGCSTVSCRCENKFCYKCGSDMKWCRCSPSYLRSRYNNRFIFENETRVNI